MARTVETGIEITAKDKASPIIRKASAASSAALNGMRTSAERVAQGMKSVGKAAIVLNQAMELGKKAFRAFSVVVLESIDVAGKYRSANDASMKAMADMGKQIELVRARIGDALLPVMRGLAESFKPVLQSTQAWLTNNHKLVASKIGEWVVWIGQTLTNVVAKGTILAAKAWLGWQAIIAAVRLLVLNFFSIISKGFAGLTYAASRVAAALGKTEMAAWLESVTESAANLGAEFDRSSDATIKDLMAAQAEVQVLENKVNSAAASAKVFWSEAGEAIKKSIAESTAGGKTSIEDLKKAQEEAAALHKVKLEEEHKRILGMIAERDAHRKASLQLQEEMIRKAEVQQAESMARQREDMEATAQIAGQAVGALGAAMISQQQSTGEAITGIMAGVVEEMLQMIMQRAMANITANAAEGASSAAAANASVPIVGPALAAAAGAAMFAMVMAYKAKVTGFNRGGLVPGVGNRDSVPAMLTPGEVVIPAPVVRQYAGGGGGGSGTVNLSLHSIAPPTNKADLRKQLRDVVGPELKRLARLGQLKLA